LKDSLQGSSTKNPAEDKLSGISIIENQVY
jgi:hypothetical protein